MTEHTPVQTTKFTRRLGGFVELILAGFPCSVNIFVLQREKIGGLNRKIRMLLWKLQQKMLGFRAVRWLRVEIRGAGAGFVR